MPSVLRTLETPHSYQSNPWSCSIQTRPTSMYYESFTTGEHGCTAADCSAAVNPIGTISLWWVGIGALFVVLWHWLARRDWRAGAIAAGMIGGYLPWFAFQHRTVFTFYAVAFEPYVVLAVTFCIGLFVAVSREFDPIRWRTRWYAVGAYLLVTLALFAFFYPVYVGSVIPTRSGRGGCGCRPGSERPVACRGRVVRLGVCSSCVTGSS
jgi:dolichyl-phosphate-mannose-protein mannosyltransferase